MSIIVDIGVGCVDFHGRLRFNPCANRRRALGKTQSAAKTKARNQDYSREKKMLIFARFVKVRPGYSIANQVDSNQIACALIPNQRNDESNKKLPHQKNVKSHHGNVESHQTSQTWHQVFAVDAFFKIIESKCAF